MKRKLLTLIGLFIILMIIFSIANYAENLNTNITNSDTIESSDVSENPSVNLIYDAKIKILPVINSNTIGELEAGDEVTVISKTNNWAFIQSKEITGWIALVSLQDTNTTEVKEEKDTNTEATNSEVVETNTEVNNSTSSSSNTTSAETTTTTYKTSTKYVGTTSAYIRSKASTSSEIVATLIKDTDVKVVGEDGDWYKVKYNDFSGYIRKDLLVNSKSTETSRSSTVDRELSLESSSTNNLGNQVVEYAKQYLGCPYSYGASGSSSFDCSGFTMYVYKHFGYTLSHSAVAQSKCGSAVEKSNLQPGDLVFFEDYETKDGIGHCGIYIGDGNFIHASSGTGYCVKISTLLSGSYYNRYMSARRIL